MRSLRSGAIVAAASFVFVSHQASAQSVAPRERDADVVVTATRIEQPVTDVIGAVSVITRRDIENRAAQSVQDLLRGETGLTVTNAGGLGKLSYVFMRGADAEQVLVLVDGVRVGSVSSGTTPFEYIPVEQIDRIEIIRGPRSSLYGSDAIGGVIQIFTRKSTTPSFNVGVGSHETYTAYASFGFATDRSWLSVAGNRISSEGYNSCAGAPFPPGGGCFTHEPDRDGYENTSGTVRIGHRWHAAELEATALYATGTSEYDGTFANETDFVERITTVRARIDLAERWSISVLAGESADHQDNFLSDPAGGKTVVSRFDTTRRHASLQSDFHLARAHTLSAGADYFDDRISSTTAFEATSRDNLGVFVQYQGAFGAHRFLASARHDDNEQYGTYETGSIGWKWLLDDRWSISAAWGKAFGAPTFNDLYFPGFSNPELDPETSHSYELGLSWRSVPLAIALTAFQRDVDDLIVYDARIAAPNNLNRARIRGLEGDLDATLGAWRLNVGATVLDPRNRTPGLDFDNYLPRRPRTFGHVEIGRSFGRIDGRARISAEGSRYDDVGNTIRLGSFVVVDLVLDCEVAPGWTLQGKIGNALDRHYRTVHLYNQDGRTFFVALRYQPR
ncbi:MAG: TonB-dependent receptor [Gammaproteobacteria bacterium]|nr:TonB-dependent vitamin B12 receptor [Gammaproteobacteria bacterium]